MLVILFFVFIIGLCIGSFLNVVVLRSLSGESIVFPPSKCPKCNARLYWWHNIPVLSYIILRGKCGFCKEPISVQYPIVELLTGIAFVLVFLKFGLSIDTLVAWIISSLFIVIAATDWKEKVVFDVHTYALIGIGLIYGLVITGLDMFQYYSLMGTLDITTEWLVGNHLVISVLGAIEGFVIMEIVARLGYLFAGSRAFGEGDSFIAAGLGAVFGWKLLLTVLILSVIIQVIITLPVFVKKEIEEKNWMTIISLGVFLVYTGAFYMAKEYGWLNSSTTYILCAVVLAGLGLLTCREILTGLKTSGSKTYLPFGPAMILAGFVVLLF